MCAQSQGRACGSDPVQVSAAGPRGLGREEGLERVARGADTTFPSLAHPLPPQRERGGPSALLSPFTDLVRQGRAFALSKVTDAAAHVCIPGSLGALCVVLKSQLFHTKRDCAN